MNQFEQTMNQNEPKKLTINLLQKLKLLTIFVTVKL